MESVIFLYSKGAETRRKIIQQLYMLEKNNSLTYLTALTDNFELSKVALKKHVDKLTQLGYINKLNPNGKPAYLKLSDKGRDIAKRFILY